MIHSRLSHAACVLALAICVALPASAADKPQDFIQSMGDRAISELAIKGLNTKDRAERFRKILGDGFDVPTIARFVLGRYWPAATPQQREEFVALFESFIVQAYAARFGDYAGEKFKVEQVRDLDTQDKLVSSRIDRPQGPPVRLDWRVRAPDESYKVVDVAVDGVSMGVTHRDEFAAVISRSGGRVEGLLEALRKKTSN